MGSPLVFLFSFVLGLLVYTLSLWISAKLLGDEGKFLEFLIIAAIAAVVGLIPFFGGWISIVVFFCLLQRLMDIRLLKSIVICTLAFLLRFGLIQGLVWLMGT